MNSIGGRETVEEIGEFRMNECGSRPQQHQQLLAVILVQRVRRVLFDLTFLIDYADLWRRCWRQWSDWEHTIYRDIEILLTFFK